MAQASSGGAGGMDWAALGAAIYDDVMTGMDFFSGLKEKAWDRQNIIKQQAEQQRQFGIEAKQKGRSQNQAGLGMLYNRIDTATERANKKGGGLTFDTALSNALRNGVNYA